jgi:hypothetical protein
MTFVPRLALIALVLAASAPHAFAQATAAAAPDRPGTFVITGQLKTVDGTAADAVRVSALQAPPPNVRPQDGIQYYLAPPPIRTVMTDRDGRYRINNLPPGRYFVAAGVPGQDTYYPNALDGYEATVVTLGTAATTTIDFALVTPLAGRISGRVVPAPDPGVQETAILSGVFLTELVDTPIHADGSFEFGRVPAGTYLVDLFPTYPGLKSILFDVSNSVVSSLELKRPKLYTVSGRFNVARGPLPWALLAFYTDTSYAAADIKDDGTFSVRLHAATHLTDLAGMPSDYEMTRIRRGNQDVTKGLTVTDGDVTGLIIDVAVPDDLPRMRGRVTGAAANRLASMRVEISGPIVGKLESAVKPDGSFEFQNLTPGGYWVTIPQATGLEPLYVFVDFDGADVTLAVPAR